MKIFTPFACVLLLVMSQTLTGQDLSKSDNSGNRLKILSWNIYMLPRAILKTAKKERAEAIAEELSQTDYDILVFQEAFHPLARRILSKKLGMKYPNHYGPANSSGVKYNSGVWVMSKIPMKEIKQIRYRNCKGYDCYSQKGAMMLEGSKNGNRFQLIGTHLQSDGPQEIRKSQYDQIRKELQDPYTKENVLQIICGDFNTYDSDSSSYHSMMKTLDSEDGAICGNVCNTYRGGNDRIDYILLRKNGSKVKREKRDIKVFSHNWKGSKNRHISSPELSDHNAMELDIEF